MKTGLRKIKENYVLSCIDSDGYGVVTDTDLKKLEFLAKTFKEEFCYIQNLQRYDYNYIVILKEWIMGLPSSFNVDFNYCDIIKLGNKWDYNLITEKKENDFINNWFNMISNITIQLFNRHNIEYK